MRQVKDMLENHKIWIIFLFLLVLTGCSTEDTTPKSHDASKATNGGELVISSVREPDTLDVQKTTWVDNANVHLFDYLIGRDMDGSIIPGLVKDYTIADDGKSWTFHLRENVKFHSGEELTAESVKASMERFIKQSPVNFLAGPITGVEASDKSTLIVNFSEPYAPFIAGLTSIYLSPLDPAALKSEGDKFGNKPSGTGPLLFEKWIRGDSITFVKNEQYNWGPDDAENKGGTNVDKVVFRFIKDENTRMLEFNQGNIQIMLDVPPSSVKTLENTSGVQLHKLLDNGLTYLAINNDKPLFQDPKVRKAINLAIDRNQIVQYAMEGYAKPMYGPLSPTIPGYSEKVEKMAEQMYTRNVEQAKQLLHGAGWSNVNGNGVLVKEGKQLSIELLLTDEPVMQRIAQILQNQLKEVGIDLRITVQDDSTIRTNESKKMHDLILWQYGWSDPDILYILFGKDIPTRLFSTPELEELLIKGRQTMDEKARMAVYEKVQELLVTESPWVPLFARERITAYRDIEGFKVNPYKKIVIQDIKLKKQQ